MYTLASAAVTVLLYSMDLVIVEQILGGVHTGKQSVQKIRLGHDSERISAVRILHDAKYRLSDHI